MAHVMQPSQMPYGGPLHRKPIPKPGIAVRPPQPYSSRPGPLDPYQQLPTGVTGHSRTRTSSSGVFPMPSASPTTYTHPATMTTNSQYPPQYPTQQQAQGTRRTLSNATSSTSSTTGTPNRSNSGAGALRRSSSSRSGTNTPTSYVALMRKQKATVWCDRAQYEDPRILAAQRAAKMRANMEVAGGPHHGAPRAASSSSSVAAGVRSKITHRAPKASLYAPVNLAGTGVPMRLSASEVDEGDSEDNGSVGGPYHHRTGSGRSSLGSGRRVVAGGGPGARVSSNSTPPNGVVGENAGMADLAEEETPGAGAGAGYPSASSNYFEHTQTGLSGRSGRSGSSGERQFGDVGAMPASVASRTMAAREKKGAEELHRRGSVMSVDERTMTMSGTRLFIANPDLSD